MHSAVYQAQVVTHAAVHLDLQAEGGLRDAGAHQRRRQRIEVAGRAVEEVVQAQVAAGVRIREEVLEEVIGQHVTGGERLLQVVGEGAPVVDPRLPVAGADRVHHARHQQFGDGGGGGRRVLLTGAGGGLPLLVRRRVGNPAPVGEGGVRPALVVVDEVHDRAQRPDLVAHAFDGNGEVRLGEGRRAHLRREQVALPLRQRLERSPPQEGVPGPCVCRCHRK